jgi:hypothetical protein
MRPSESPPSRRLAAKDWRLFPAPKTARFVRVNNPPAAPDSVRHDTYGVRQLDTKIAGALRRWQDERDPGDSSPVTTRR